MPSALTTSISIERDVPVTMRDGTVLAADVWRAVDAAEPGPVLLQRTAYDKGELHVATHHAGLDPLRAIAAGFTVVLQDVRGRFASDGVFSPFTCEAADGADTIAWLREQPFCDGRVCTYGTSYNGAVQLLAAGERPAGLAALSAIETASPRHDGLTHLGGAVSAGFLAAWAANDLAPPELARRAAAGEDVAVLAADVETRRRDPRDAARRLASGRLGALGMLVPALAQWLAQTPPAGAGARARAAAWPGVAVPALHVGGWFDLFLEATLQTYAELDGQTAGQRLVVGPWAHGETGSRIGARDFGPDASQAALDLTALQLAFFTAVLEDRLDDVAPVRVFVMGADRWREEERWPPARMQPVRLHLHGFGALGAERPAAGDPSDTYIYDPAAPVPTTGGATILDPALGAPGPAEQRAVEDRADVLTYTTRPLATDVELMGPVRATLFAATTAASTDWTVKLVDVAPDGVALSVCDGAVRAAAPDPGVAARHEVRVGSTALRVPAGHRLRIEVSSSNFPRIDAHPLGARQRVFHDAAHPSSVDLPVTSGALT
jgi:uncharacterized protein